jgi:hypothetical protein
MVKISKSEKSQSIETSNYKEKVLGEYNIKLYDDEQCEKLYEQELKTNLHKFLSNKINDKISNIKVDNDNEDIEDNLINASKLKKSILKNLSFEDLEKIFPQTTTYIKNCIYHGYDSMYYVLNKNQHGHILPLEYNNANFNSTYQKYFGEHIKTWFEKYSRKYVLSIDNTKPRTYKLNGTNYLNLFSGYKFDKTEKRDQKRVDAGKEGVNFIWNHIYEIWNSSNKECFEYDKKWIRKLVCGHKLKTMLYLKGKMGRGKTAIVKFIMKVLGEHTTLTISNDAPFMTEFNGSLVGITLCLLDEIVHDFNSFKSLYNKLKPYITDDSMSYRNLYEKLKQLMNITSFILCGNYDMLRLDDPTKGEDRRTKVNDVKDEVKDAEYCNKLDKYLTNEDVIYSFFWDCIDNYEEFNEGQELKKLPITETKKNMIILSLDSSINFLKSSINEKSIMDKYIKPADLYLEYEIYINDNDKKGKLNKQHFLEKIKDLKDFIRFEVKRLGGKEKTNYCYIDRAKMIKSFKEKHYFNEYDDVYENFSNDENNGLDSGLSEPHKNFVSENFIKGIETNQDNTDYKKENEELKKKLKELEEQIKLLQNPSVNVSSPLDYGVENIKKENEENEEITYEDLEKELESIVSDSSNKKIAKPKITIIDDITKTIEVSSSDILDLINDDISNIVKKNKKSKK